MIRTKDRIQGEGYTNPEEISEWGRIATQAVNVIHDALHQFCSRNNLEIRGGIADNKVAFIIIGKYSGEIYNIVIEIQPTVFHGEEVLVK